jgi:hypothetical protein
MFKLTRILITHGITLVLGIVLGIYLLPILIAPQAPSDAEVAASSDQVMFTGQFRKELPGSDFLHWGEGQISVSARKISFKGSLAPGPDYKLYLTPDLALTEQEFMVIKDQSAYVGDVKTFDNFILSLPENIDPSKYKAVIVWCETFGEFISAASYQ